MVTHAAVAQRKEDGAALQQVRQRKQLTYPDLSGAFGRARIAVLAVETGSRWSHEAHSFVCPSHPEGSSHPGLAPPLVFPARLRQPLPLAATCRSSLRCESGLMQGRDWVV